VRGDTIIDEPVFKLFDGTVDTMKNRR